MSGTYQGYKTRSGPFPTEREARQELKGVEGMVWKGDPGWFVLEICHRQIDDPW